MVENLLGEVFVTINSVTEGIDVLQNMYQYSKRKNLAAEFEKRTVKVRSHYKLNQVIQGWLQGNGFGLAVH